MADTLDVITLPVGKAAIGMPEENIDHDDTIARHITAISRIIDDKCGPVVQRTVSAELHDTWGDDIVLHYSPVTSIGTVREAAGGVIATLGTVGFGDLTDGYLAERDWRDPSLYSGVLQRRWAGRPGCWTRGAQVEVTYVAGRYANTAAVGADFADAACAVLRRLWKREAGTWAQSATFFQDNDSVVGSGFFRVAAPIIDELLPHQTRLPGHA